MHCVGLRLILITWDIRLARSTENQFLSFWSNLKGCSNFVKFFILSSSTLFIYLFIYIYTRRRATAFVITRTASATTTRCGPIRPMPRKRAMEPSWRCRAFYFPPAASCPVTAAVFQVSMPCGRGRNGRGTRMCCAATPFPPRRN